MADRTLGDLTPNQFENLTYDLLCMLGLQNAVWRTPGADGGRDIEGVVAVSDFSGHILQQKWYIECKRYSNSIDWPTIYEKIAYADGNLADYMLLSTNSNPSPSCETQIQGWNSQRHRVKIRVWRGLDLERILNQFPEVRAKYGVGKQDVQQAIIGLHPLMFEVMKVIQSAYSHLLFDQDALAEIETCAALSEFVTVKSQQLTEAGRIYSDSTLDQPPNYPWLDWEGWNGSWTETGMRAILSFFRHATQAEKISVSQSGGRAAACAEKPKYSLSTSAVKALRSLCFWSLIELEAYSESSISFCKSIEVR